MFSVIELYSPDDEYLHEVRMGGGFHGFARWKEDFVEKYNFLYAPFGIFNKNCCASYLSPQFGFIKQNIVLLLGRYITRGQSNSGKITPNFNHVCVKLHDNDFTFSQGFYEYTPWAEGSYERETRNVGL